jgi:hypothetical protein
MEDNSKTVVKDDEDGEAAKPAEATVEKKAAEQVEEKEVPRRNADYWKNETEREKTREARADFFKAKKKAKDPETGEDLPDDEQPLTRAEVKAMLEGNRREQQLADRDKADAIEITSFLAKPENAKFSKHEADARRYMKAHPYYPISGVFRDLAYDDAIAEGARRAAKAEAKSQRNSFEGSERRPVTAKAGMPDFSGMSGSERSAALKKFKADMKSGRASFGNDDDE